MAAESREDLAKESRKTSKYGVFVCLFIGYSVFYYNRKSYTSLIPTFLQTLGLEETDLGTITSSFAVSYGLSKFISGILVDKCPPREFFVASLIGTGLCSACFTLCSGVNTLALVWFVHGLFQGFSWPPATKILKAYFRPDEIGKFWSFLTVGCNMTASICPLLTIYFKSKYNWQTAMVVPGSIALVFAPVFYMRVDASPCNKSDLPNVEHHVSSCTKPLKTRWTKVLPHLLCSPFLWVLFHGYFLASLMKSSFEEWLQLYLIHDKKQSLFTAAVAMTVFEVGGMTGSIVSGVITDRWMLKHDPSKNSSARMPLFVWLFAIFCICIHFLRTADAASSTFFIGFLLFGCGMALSGTVSIYGLVAMENGPPGFSGTSQAIVALGASVGAVIAGNPIATLGETYGWHQVFLLLQILGGINFMLHLVTRGLDRRMVDPLKLQ